jgi:hypothetical protein
MPVILYLGTGSAYIKLKGLFMLSTSKIQARDISISTSV